MPHFTADAASLLHRWYTTEHRLAGSLDHDRQTAETRRYSASIADVPIDQRDKQASRKFASFPFLIFLAY
jgi:hypothetical protein